MRLAFISLAVLCAAIGCSRKSYRLWADRDAQCLIDSRQTSPEWEIPSRTVEAPPNSRMYDFHHPDHPCSRPCDDPAASKYMDYSFRCRSSKYWNRFKENAAIEQLHWSEYLPLDESGECKVDRQQAVDLALLHNRQYQSAYEQLYLSALNLSLNRYDFFNRWFGGTGTTFNAAGDGMAASRLLGSNNGLGFNRAFFGGGQFMTNLANSFVWELGGGPNTQDVSTNLIMTLTQPFLRGAFRHVRTESLTQAERNLLYDVRDFVRFRRQFYLSTVSQYLSLLTTVQGLRNTRANLESLELNLLETQELQIRDQASQIQVDQVLQQFQQGRLDVLSSEQGLQDALDDFKFALGLPPGSPIVLDESILKTFELNDPKLEELRNETDAVYDRLRQYLPPEEAPSEFLAEVATSIQPLIKAAQELLPSVNDELERWREKIEKELNDELLGENERFDLQQQKTLFARVENSLNELGTEFEEAGNDANSLSNRLSENDAITNWRSLQSLIGSRVSNQMTTLFVLQNQIRLFLIELEPFDIDIEFAVEMGLGNRLDLMNQRAIVTDAFRQVEIAADALQSDLNVSATANLATDPDRSNPLRFDGSDASYQLSIQFDGPLDRFAERNAYRAAQIAYQNARRDYMQLEDGVKNTLRSAVRQLKINRLIFQITRQQLITATRRVDEAQINLRDPSGSGGSTSRTRDLLEALQDLLDARNGLIQSWINYEVARITLFVEMEMLYLDDSGEWINERYNPRQDRTVDRVDSDSSADLEVDDDPEPSSERQAPIGSDNGGRSADEQSPTQPGFEDEST